MEEIPVLAVWDEIQALVLSLTAFCSALGRVDSCTEMNIKQILAVIPEIKPFVEVLSMPW